MHSLDGEHVDPFRIRTLSRPNQHWRLPGDWSARRGERGRGRTGAGGREGRQDPFFQSSPAAADRASERLVRIARQQRGPMAQSKVVKQVLTTTPPPPPPRLASEARSKSAPRSPSHIARSDPHEKRQSVTDGQILRLFSGSLSLQETGGTGFPSARGHHQVAVTATLVDSPLVPLQIDIIATATAAPKVV